MNQTQCKAGDPYRVVSARTRTARSFPQKFRLTSRDDVPAHKRRRRRARSGGGITAARRDERSRIGDNHRAAEAARRGPTVGQTEQNTRASEVQVQSHRRLLPTGGSIGMRLSLGRERTRGVAG